ncbi:gastrokine-1-like [Pleurodeles waltl]|uniref:gastrokine-1-like n=1 Tax=Pleurodeles waltl TaxID=8319 RepID=UPI0037093A85
MAVKGIYKVKQWDRVNGSIVAQADDDVNISNQGNDGGDVHQTVNIYNHETIININEFNGWNSWDSIFDFNRGLFAVRPFSKQSCVVSRMNKAAFPNFAQLSKLAREKAPIRSISSQHLMYSVPSAQKVDVAQFGPYIDAICRGLPTYLAKEVQEDTQLILSLTEDKSKAKTNFQFCMNNIPNWKKESFLKLNSDETEILQL